jgi:hypothetical protein
MMGQISRGEFARKLSCSRTYVQQLIREGAIPAEAINGDGITPLIALEGIHRLVSERSKIYAPAEAWLKELGGPGQVKPAKKAEGEKESIAEAKLRKAIAEANIKEIEVAEKRKTLVDAREVELEAFRMARQLRDAILAIPDRVASILAAETDEHTVRQTLDTEFRNVLMALATGE